MLHHPIFGQLLLGPENCNSCLEVLFCCCRTFLGLIVIYQAHFCLFVWRVSWHFVQITQNLPMVLLWALLLFWTGGGGHTKVDWHANYANRDMLAVLILFRISILSAVQGSSKTEWHFYLKKPLMWFCMTCCYFFALNCICKDKIHWTFEAAEWIHITKHINFCWSSFVSWEDKKGWMWYEPNNISLCNGWEPTYKTWLWKFGQLWWLRSNESGKLCHSANFPQAFYHYLFSHNKQKHHFSWSRFWFRLTVNHKCQSDVT